MKSVAALFIALASLASAAVAQKPDDLLATANGHKIYFRDLSPDTQKLVADMPARTAKFRSDILTQMMNERALASEAKAAVGDPPRGVAVLADDRSREDARAFALQCLEAGAPWVVSGTRAPEPSLVLARRRGEASPDLKAWVPELLAAARGKGGGSPELVTISPADAAGAEEAYAIARERLERGSA